MTKTKIYDERIAVSVNRIISEKLTRKAEELGESKAATIRHLIHRYC